jgi:hypothetical protein
MPMNAFGECVYNIGVYFSMAFHQIMAGDGLQIWRVVANILNKPL